MNFALFVCDAIFPHWTLVHVASHSCSRDKTRKTERLNSQGNQHNRDLKNGGERGGTISKTVTDYLTACFVTLPLMGSRPSISVQSDYIACENPNQRDREACVTWSNSPSLLSNMQLEKSFWNSIPCTSPVHTVLRKRADNIDYCERGLTPQLREFQSHSCMCSANIHYWHWRRQCQDVNI